MREINGQKLAKIIARRYQILRELHPNSEYLLTELRDKMKGRGIEMDLGNLSKYVIDLEKRGLIKTREVKRRGRSRRCIRLKTETAQIISMIEKMAKVTPEPKYEPLTVDLCLDVMGDDGLDEETRKLYADSLHSRFTSVPEKMLRKHKKLRETLEKVIKNPPADGGVGGRKKSMLSVTMPRLIRDEWGRSWVMKHVYPNVLELLKDENKTEGVVTWAISMLEDIGMHGSDPTVREEIRGKLKEAYFNEVLDPNSKVAGELSGSILRMFCREPKSARDLANHLRERAKKGEATEREKEKAILLLKGIAGHLPH